MGSTIWGMEVHVGTQWESGSWGAGLHGGAEAALVTSPRRVKPLRATPMKRILAVVESGS